MTTSASQMSAYTANDVRKLSFPFFQGRRLASAVASAFAVAASLSVQRTQ